MWNTEYSEIKVAMKANTNGARYLGYQTVKDAFIRTVYFLYGDLTIYLFLCKELCGATGCQTGTIDFSS